MVTGHPGGHLILANAFQDAWGGAGPLRRTGLGVALRFQSAFDTNGVLYHIGTAGGTQEYQNPCMSQRVVAQTSDGTGSSTSDTSLFVQHHHDQHISNHTENSENAWMAVDLGEGRTLRPNHYCLRGDRHYHNNFQNWHLEGSHNGSTWVTLRKHQNDSSLPVRTPMSTAAWPVVEQAEAFRHFRILQTGMNSGRTWNLMCTGIELYGLFFGSPS